MDLNKTVTSSEEEIIDLVDLVSNEESVQVKSQWFYPSENTSESDTSLSVNNEVTAPQSINDAAEHSEISSFDTSQVTDLDVISDLIERVDILERTVKSIEEKIAGLLQRIENITTPSNLSGTDSIVELPISDISKEESDVVRSSFPHYEQLVSRIEKCEISIRDMETAITNSAVKAAVKTITDEISGLKKEFLIQF